LSSGHDATVVTLVGHVSEHHASISVHDVTVLKTMT